MSLDAPKSTQFIIESNKQIKHSSEENCVDKYKPIDPEKGDIFSIQGYPPNHPPPAYTKDNNNGPLKADFEAAIELTGYGRFHYILLTICGLVSTSEVIL